MRAGRSLADEGGPCGGGEPAPLRGRVPLPYRSESEGLQENSEAAKMGDRFRDDQSEEPIGDFQFEAVEPHLV